VKLKNEKALKLAKLFSTLKNEAGVEKHQTANRNLTANFFYGSREKSILSLTVNAVVEPAPQGKPDCPEKLVVNANFFAPDKRVVHHHLQEFPICQTESPLKTKTLIGLTALTLPFIPP